MINFKLPDELIAQEPANPRDTARLLVYNRATKKLTDSYFYKISDFLPKNTTLVVNNSKVEHCRWLFDNGKSEIFVLEKLDTHTIRALVRPGKKFRVHQKTELNEWLRVETTAVDDDGIRTLKLNVQHDDKRLHKIEHVPLPPYIKRNDEPANEYQTIYAKPLGSKAAPTAGLHFTAELLGKIKQKHKYAEVTLHVGLGTFASLNEENYKTGKLHSEWYSVDKPNLEIINNSKHITAVGTTSARTLESLTVQGTSLYSKTGEVTEGVSGDTDIFIQPGYKFKKVDSLITNFHLPGTSLLLMVEAIVGSENEMQKIYNHAIKEKYRFYSFGDAMLVV